MLEVIEIIRDTVQGMTRPALCRADNGTDYIIKGREAGNDGLVKEYICAALGQNFGLPIPEFGLINCSDELLSHDPELKRRFSGGPCFASKYQAQLQEFDRSAYVDKHAQLFRDIFIFDLWVKNNDRHFTVEKGGNPNLLVDSGRESIYVIDHNLAFASDFDLESDIETHVGKTFWSDQQLDMLVIDNYKSRMSNAFEEFDSIVEQLPEEWTMNEFGDVDFLQTLKQDLEQFSMNNFWSQLT